MSRTARLRSGLERLAAQTASLQVRAGDSAHESEVANTEARDVPQFIARCASPAAVAAVVLLAREHGSHLAVRGGGYSPAGFGTRDGGIVIDLSAMASTRTDNAKNTVHVDGGTTAGTLEAELARHGLGATLPVPSRIGVVGAALSGGVGVLVRKLGYISDAIVSAEIVTGDGEFRHVDDATSPELAWALRGGGGNFGVVTSLELACVPVAEITVHQLVTGRHQLAEALRYVRDWSEELPDDVTAVPFIRAIPPIPGVPTNRIGEPGLVLTTVHAGTAPQAARDLSDLAGVPGRIFDRQLRTSLLAQRTMAEAGFPHARFGAVIRSGWTRALSEADLDSFADLADRIPSTHSAIEFVRMGGATSRPARASCAPGRDATYLLNFMSVWTDPAQADRAQVWGREAAELMTHVADDAAVVPGFVSADELDRAATTYGADYPALQAVKARFDPDNLFKRNLNIVPTKSNNSTRRNNE